MNILLLYPEFPDTFWSFKHALKFVRKRASFPPLGLLTVASMLPDDWNVRLVDLNVEKLKSKQIEWADCAFVSAMIVQRDSTRKLIDSCREAGLRVVAGGPLFTNEPEQFADVDHLVLNEAEVTLPGFLEDLKNGCAKRVYESTEHPDVGGTPIPAWHLLKLRKYASMSIQFSRGCPFNCDFCNVTAMFGHKPRVKSSAQVIAELDEGSTVEGHISTIGAALSAFGPHGGGGGGGGTSIVSAMLEVEPGSTISGKDFADRWREEVGAVAGVESFVLDARIGSADSAIEVQLTHMDRDMLEAAALHVAKLVATYQGISNIDCSFSALFLFV